LATYHSGENMVGKYKLALSALCLAFGPLLTGCGGHAGLVYASEDGLVYVSKKTPPLRFEVPDRSWKVAFPTPAKVYFQHAKDSQRTLSLTYSSLKNASFYRDVLSPREFLEEYFRWEEEYLRSSDPSAKLAVVARDVEGPAIPNILWFVEGKNGKFYSLAFTKGDKQLSLASHNVKATNEGRDFIVDVFRSLRFLTEEQVDEITANINYKGRLSSEP
jgi:hypothetical protein